MNPSKMRERKGGSCRRNYLLVHQQLHKAPSRCDSFFLHIWSMSNPMGQGIGTVKAAPNSLLEKKSNNKATLIKTGCRKSSKSHQNYFYFCLFFYMEPKFLDLKGTFKIVQSDLILLKKK